ncbi:MAG TPA: extracellular solute-binding protein, partial [Bacillota bacterium]|nr:extracellular solute-binding protein [Bacillota bacterium]
ALQAWADGAAKANPQYKYEVNAVSDPTQYKNLIKTKIAAGDPADIMFGPPRDQMELIKAGNIADVTGAPFIKNYDPEILKGVSVDGKIYGIPVDLGLLLVYYNKDIFEKNGIQIPKTYDEFIKVCETLKGKGINPVSYGFKDAWTAGVDFMFEWYMMLVKEPNMFKDVEAGTKKFKDYPMFKRGMERNRQRVAFSTNNPFGTDNNKSVQLFASGQAAMFESGTWNISTIRELNKDGKFGMFMLPADNEADTRARLFLDDCFMINAHAKSMDSAYSFFNFATSSEGANVWASKTGLIPAIKGVQLQNVDEMTKDAVAVKDSGKTIFADVQYQPTGQLFDLLFSKFSPDFLADTKKSVDDYIDQFDQDYAEAAKQ